MAPAEKRRERERQRHREEIMEAAEAVFAEKGFHNTTVEEVAARSEFSVGTLYNFFSSKEELYKSLIEKRIQQISEDANAALDEASDPETVIRAFIEAKIGLVYKYESFAKLYTRERMGDRFSNAELWRDKMGPFFEQVVMRLAQAFQEGMEQGLIRSDQNPYDMAIALDGMTDEFMFEWLVNPERMVFKDKGEVIFRLFFEGVQKR